MNYLRGHPSNSIDRIEIITNPSRKYDAAGNSGIIDIPMKKDQRMGTNGTFTAGYGSKSLSTNATRYHKIDGSAQQPNYVLDGNQKGNLF